MIVTWSHITIALADLLNPKMVDESNLHDPVHWLIFPYSSANSSINYFVPSSNRFLAWATEYNKTGILLACAKYAPSTLIYSHLAPLLRMRPLNAISYAYLRRKFCHYIVSVSRRQLCPSADGLCPSSGLNGPVPEPYRCTRFYP